MHAAVTERYLYLYTHSKPCGGDQDNYNAVNKTFHLQMVLYREIGHGI